MLKETWAPTAASQQFTATADCLRPAFRNGTGIGVPQPE
jgi:hypothetical protein